MDPKINFRSAAPTIAPLRCQDCEPGEIAYQKRFPDPSAASIFPCMEALETVSVGTLDARLRWAIEAWCARENMSVRAFGTAALRDHDFVASLGRGRSPRLATADRVLAFMGEPPGRTSFP